MDGAAKSLADRSGNDGQAARAADDVDPGDVARVLRAEERDERLDGFERAFDEGSRPFVELRDRNDDGLCGRSVPERSEIDRDLPRVRMNRLLRVATFAEEIGAGRGVLREREPRFLERHGAELSVEVVPAKLGNAARRLDVVAPVGEIDERGLEGASAEGGHDDV